MSEPNSTHQQKTDAGGGDGHSKNHSNNHRKSNSAILTNGRINISLIEREIANELSNHSLSMAQDKMKKKAVHSSKDYSEFKDFVAASQLKPVSSSDMGQLFQQRQKMSGIGSVSGSGSQSGSGGRRFNQVCSGEDLKSLYDFDFSLRSKKSSGSSLNTNTNTNTNANTKQKGKITTTTTMKKEKKKKQCSSLAPTNAMELEREWRKLKLCKSPSSTLRYLLLPANANANANASTTETPMVLIPKKLRLTPESAAALCKIEMESSMMGDILQALDYFISVSTKPSTICTVPASGSGSASVKSTETENETETEPWNFVYRWMKSLTKCGRFDLNVEFFEHHQKIIIASIFKYLEECINIGIDIGIDIDIGRIRFERAHDAAQCQIVESDIASLQTMYKL